MVNILSPKSVYVVNDDPSTYTLTWAGSITGQIAYEILYQLKGSSAWLTAGRVNSTSTSYDLRNIYNLLGIDFSEISYKVVLTYEKTENNETTTGTESSNVYSLIFNQGIVGSLNVQNQNTSESYPIFNRINNEDIDAIKIKTSKGIKLVPLVDSSSPLSSDFKIRISNNNTRCVATHSPSFTYYTPSSSDTFGNFTVNGYYTYNYQRSYNYISTPSYRYSYITGTSSDRYRTYTYGYKYYNYLRSSVRNYLSNYYRYISSYNYRYSYSYNSTAYGYKYYNYLRSSVRNYLSEQYTYIPTRSVTVAYVTHTSSSSYMNGYIYMGPGSGGGGTTFFYGWTTVMASGSYNAPIILYGGTSGNVYTYGPVAYYYYITDRYYYYTYTNTYAYDRTYQYNYTRSDTGYKYTGDRYSYRQYYYYTYTNTYAYDRTYQYAYYHYNNYYYWNNYAYRYTADVYSYRYYTTSAPVTYRYYYKT